MTTTETKRVDRYGFPIRDCTRCGGSGRYSYNQIDGDRCYGCSGTGVQHTPKAGKAYAAWITAIRAAREPSLIDLSPGDLIRDHGSPKAVPFATVLTVTEDPYSAAGWSVLPDGRKANVRYSHTVVTDDGRIRRGMQLVRRKANVPAAPYLAMI